LKQKSISDVKEGIRGGVEDTTFEPKDSEKVRGQGQGPRTGCLEAKDRKAQGHV